MKLMKQKPPSATAKRVAAAAIGAIVVAVIGAGIWDVVARPGVSWVASALVSALTLGSATVRDLPYASAPLNPYSLPSLVILLLLVATLPFLILAPVLRRFLRTRLLQRFEQREHALRAQADSPQVAEELAAHRRRTLRRRWGIIDIVYALLLFGVSFVSFWVVNQAIAIRRIHDANMEIVAPYISTEERLRLQARFAAMTTAREHLALRSELERIAKAHGIRLRPEII